MNKKLITFVLLGIIQNLYPMEPGNHGNIKTRGELVCRAGGRFCAGVAGIGSYVLYYQMMNNSDDVISKDENKVQDVAVTVGLAVLTGYSLGTALTDLRNAYNYSDYLNKATENSKKRE